MAKYLCQTCTENNNGWCPKKKMNGLKKLNLIKPEDCADYNGNEHADTFVTFSKSKDGENRPHLTIKINNEVAFLPTQIITDFLINEAREISIRIPGDE